MANVDSASSHGTKRRAVDGLESEQRLSKRFDLLNLEHNGKLWVSPSAYVISTNGQLRNEEPDDYMRVEDTKDRVYIHNLDEELADLSEEESKLVFLPDIEKQLNQIPKHVLISEQSKQPTGYEVVLYTVPTSLSVPPEQDSVRKAILESRARAREKTAQQERYYAGSRDAHLHDEAAVNSSEVNGGSSRLQDPDAMEIE